MTTLELTVTGTPVGPMALFALDGQLVGLTLDGGHGTEHPVAQHLTRHLGEFTTREVPDAAGAATRLARYFAGDVGALDEQPMRLHRVIAADGTLWGYGGGLPMKQWLLRHEGAAFRPLADQKELAL